MTVVYFRREVDVEYQQWGYRKLRYLTTLPRACGLATCSQARRGLQVPGLHCHADRQSTPRWLGLTGHGRHAVSLFRGVGMGAPSPFEFRFHGASAVIAPRASAPPHTSSTHFSLTPLVTYRHPRAFVVGFVQHFRDEELQRRTPHLPRRPRAQPVVDSNHHVSAPRALLISNPLNTSRRRTLRTLLHHLSGLSPQSAPPSNPQDNPV